MSGQDKLNMTDVTYALVMRAEGMLILTFERSPTPTFFNALAAVGEFTKFCNQESAAESCC